MGPIEARAGHTRTRNIKPASESQVCELCGSPRAGVQRGSFFGEEAGGSGPVGVGEVVATGAVEPGMVARTRVGPRDELTGGVVAVVG